MKICYIGWGHSIHMQRWISWFAKRGHEVHLITDHPVPMEKITVHDISSKTDTRPRYIRYWKLGFNIKFVRLLKSTLKISNLVKMINPDILHLHTLLYPSYLGAYTKFHPLVVTPWNGDILWFRKKSITHKFMVRYALRNADLITYNSFQMRDKCMSLGVQKSRLHMFQCPGVHLKSFYPQGKSEELKKSLNLEDSPVVLSTRSISHEYNIDIIIKSIPYVLAKISEAKFIFLWYFENEEEIEKIRELSNGLKIESAVRFLGREDYTELPKYFNTADVFVSISSNDSAPMSLLEAMACGVPPVIADHPAVNELVKDGWNGCVVPQRNPQATAQAIIKLLDDENTRKLFAKRNLQWVRENADYDKNMEQVEKLYYKLVEERKGKRSDSIGGV